MNLPGHSIPYSFTQDEVNQFLAEQLPDNQALADYIQTKTPEYGIVVNEAYGQILVWFDQGAGVLHCIDVTNLSIANQVQKAEYQSPDQSMIDNMVSSISALAKSVQGGLGAGVAIGVAALIILFLLPKRTD